MQNPCSLNFYSGNVPDQVRRFNTWLESRLRLFCELCQMLESIPAWRLLPSLDKTLQRQQDTGNHRAIISVFEASIELPVHFAMLDLHAFRTKVHAALQREHDSSLRALPRRVRIRTKKAYT